MDYTQKLNPWIPHSLIPIVAGVATFLEIIFAFGLLTNFKTSLMATCSGFLLLLFAFAMTFAVNIKAPVDYSVFTAAAGAFALSLITKRNANQEV